MNRIASFALALGLVAAGFAPAAAQSTWLDREHRPSVLVETLFPNFDSGSDGIFDSADTGFPTWTWFAAARLPTGETTMFVAELPYSRGELQEGSFSESGATIGNPYLGIEYAPRPSGFLLEFGARIPLASDEMLLPILVGFYTDVEREEAFVHDRVPVRLGLHYHRAASANAHIAYDVRLVPSVWISTDDMFDSSAETEAFLGYGAWVRYEGESVRVGGGLTGRWITSNDGADFSEASVHQFDLGADFLRGAVRPGVQLKLPLDDDLTSVLNSVVGVSITILPGL